ncbi:SUKH-3 domain-containing protein [Pendulispora brunnea]|uniref:SUKH-3 domain-containing protein n=1 Tax=Pendulispora brunnea TaxID=2905690 RepID=A0ABZ2K493_9BACT
MKWVRTMLSVQPKVILVLQHAGWSPDRFVTISKWSDYFVKKGFFLSPDARTILENLGGLKITPPTSPTNLFNPTEFHFDPYYAASSEVDRIKQWEQDYCVKLFPIGEVGRQVILLCGDDGKIYGAGLGCVKLIGVHISEALDTLVLAERQWSTLSG